MSVRLLTRGLGIVAMAAILGACTGSGFGLSQRNPDSLYGNYLAARHAGSVRDMDAAANFYARALAEDPGNPVIVERAFLLSVTAGNVSEALNLTSEIIERDPDNRTARLVRALSALKAADFGRTINEIDAAAPGPFTALVGTLAKAWAAAGQKQPDQAYEALESFRDRPAFDLFRILHEALIADYLGDFARARTGYIAAQSASSGASLRIVQAYGRFLETQGDTELAREVYNNYGRLAPDHPIIENALQRIKGGIAPAPLVKTPADGMAEALYGLASALAQESGIDISILYTQLALYLRGDFDVARTLLADLYERGDRLDDAISAYGRIARTSPLYQNAQIQIAVDLDRLDKSKEAIARLRTLIRQYPDSIEPLTALGDILRGRKEYAAAVSEYSKAIELSGEPDARFWTIYYARGMCYERLKLWPSAQKDLQLALELSGDHPLVLNYLGYSWIEQKVNLEDAMAMIRRAVELRPDDGYIVDSLGWAYFNIGDYESAVTHLERAVQLQPDDVTINDHLGDAFWRVGRRIEARFQWQHALELEPDEEQERDIKEKLKNGLKDADVEMSADAGS